MGLLSRLRSKISPRSSIPPPDDFFVGLNLSRKEIDAEPGENVEYLWGRPRFNNEGRVGKFHLLTPGYSLAVCGYFPSNDLFRFNEIVSFEKAVQLADDPFGDFCKKCRAWVDKSGIGY